MNIDDLFDIKAKIAVNNLTREERQHYRALRECGVPRLEANELTTARLIRHGRSECISISAFSVNGVIFKAAT